MMCMPSSFIFTMNNFQTLDKIEPHFQTNISALFLEEVSQESHYVRSVLSEVVWFSE